MKLSTFFKKGNSRGKKFDRPMKDVLFRTKEQVLFLFMCSLSLENVKKMFVLSVFSSCVFRLEDAKKMQELVSSLRAQQRQKAL